MYQVKIVEYETGRRFEETINQALRELGPKVDVINFSIVPLVTGSPGCTRTGLYAVILYKILEPPEG